MMTHDNAACVLDDRVVVCLAATAVAGYVASLLWGRVCARWLCNDKDDACMRDEMTALTRQAAELDTVNTIHLRGRVQRRLLVLQRAYAERAEAQRQRRARYDVAALVLRVSRWMWACASRHGAAARTRSSDTCTVATLSCRDVLREAGGCACYHAPALITFALRSAHVLYALTRRGAGVCVTRSSSLCSCGVHGGSAVTCMSCVCGCGGDVVWWTLLCYAAVWYTARVFR